VKEIKGDIEAPAVPARTENGHQPQPSDGFQVGGEGVPFYVQIVRPSGEMLQIDVEEHGWATTHAEWMRGRSRWYLMRKATGMPVLVVEAQEGDQPYYTARHVVRVKGHNAGGQVVAYGIGAKRVDGRTDRLWILPGGLVCGGEDADTLGDAIIDAIP